MGNFICKVRTPQGQITKVKMNEKDEITCLKKLKRNGMTPISVKKSFSINQNYDKNLRRQKKLTANIASKNKRKSNINFNEKIQFLNRVSFDELKKFTEEFYLLKTMNFTNTRILTTLIDSTENLYFKQVLNKILKNLKSGIQMYKSMKNYPNIFPSVYRNFIKSGELTGNLEEFLKHAITYLEDENKIRNKLKNDLIPSIITFCGILVMTILAVLIGIPSIEKMIETNGNMLELPKITKFFLNFINVILKYWYIVLAIIIGLIIGMFRYINTEKGRYKFDYSKYSNFLFGKLRYLIDFSRVINSITINFKGKMRIQDALEISKTVINNTYMLSKIEDAISNIYMGKNWISAFEKEKLINPIIIEMLKKCYAQKSLEGLDKILEFLNLEIKKETEKLLKRLPEISYIVVGIALLMFFIIFLIPCIQIYLGGFLFL